MKRIVLCSILLGALLAVELFASGRTGIYGIVERVVFEPGAESPERVQVWGAFALIERTDTLSQALRYRGATVAGDQAFTNYVFGEPVRGYLYFELPEDPGEVGNARREWADLASVSGTGQVVAFGYADRRRGDVQMRLRETSEDPADPDPYYTDVGVARLTEAGNHAAIVSALRQLTD